MDLTGKNVCFVSAFSAPYGGNFIKMLQALAVQLHTQYHCRVYFAFPVQTEKDWLRELSDNYEVGYIKSDNIVSDLTKKFKLWDIDLVHTHFEAYDVAVAKAIRKSSKQIKQVWHVHDYMSLDKTGLSFPSVRKLLTNQRFWNQYGKYGKNAYFIAVSDEMAQFVNHYRRHRYRYPSEYKKKRNNDKLIRTSAILNGIDLGRIIKNDRLTVNKPFNFMSFGGESVSKGIHTILDACELLSKNGVVFKFCITEGYTTHHLLTSRFGSNFPDWLEVIKQSNNISDIFSKSDCYISASRCETMSMAIAEASLFGLPIIQSDIPGTLWNASSPSAFLFPVDDAIALCETMKKVIDISATGEMRVLTDKTKVLNCAKLSMAVWVNRIVGIYKSL